MRYRDFIHNRFVGQDVFIVGSGPSLTGFDYSFFEGKTVIAVNHAFKLTHCRTFTIGVFMDRNFLNESPGVPYITAIPFICPDYVDVQGDNFIKARPSIIYNPSSHSDELYSSRSSGTAAITAALHGGARRIFLFGFDCRFFSFEEVVEILRVNGAPRMTEREFEFRGHSTSGTFEHYRDDNADEHIFLKTVNLYSVFPRHNIFNISRFSAIPYFEKVAFDAFKYLSFEGEGA